MAGLFNFDQGGAGLLPFDSFDQRWAPMLEAWNKTMLPWGGMTPDTLPTSAFAYAPQGGPQAGPAPALPPPVNVSSRDVAALQPQQQAPQEPQQPAYQQAPSAPGFGDRLNAGLMGFANAGAPIPALANLFSGLMTGQRSDAAGQQQQSQQATYQALRQSGVPHGQAMAAALNPEVLKTIAPQLYTKPEWGVVRQGIFGPEYGWIDKGKQTVTVPGEGGALSGTAGAGAPTIDALVGNVMKAREAGGKPEELYKMLPPSIQEDVKAMLESRAVPANLGRNPQLRTLLVTLAHSIDPTFDETELPGRVQAMKSWKGGKDAETVRNLRQTLYHGSEELLKAFDNLSNGQYPALNAAGNLINDQVLGKAGVPEFKMNAHAFASELSKIYKQANLSDSEIHAWESSLGENLSPEQQKAVMTKAAGLLEGGLRGLQQKRAEGIGSIADQRLPPIVGKEQEDLIDRMKNWTPKGLKPAAQSSAPSSDAVRQEMIRRKLIKQ